MAELADVPVLKIRDEIDSYRVVIRAVTEGQAVIQTEPPNSPSMRSIRTSAI